MNIKVLLNAEQISCYKGLYDYLYLIINSVNNNVINTELVFFSNDIIYNEDIIITLGDINTQNNNINIPLNENYKNIADNFFGIIKNCLYKNAKQYTVRLFGNIENFEKKLKQIENNNSENSFIFYYKQDLITTIKIFCNDNSNAVYDVFSLFNKNIYADEDITLDKMLIELLTIRNKTLAVAESLTGGLICSKIIDNAGASQVFNEGVVTYSNQAKINRLNIDESIIKNNGAVSYETAYEMAAGLLKSGDISIATTGIAGPSGGTITKPVGLTYIAIGTNEKVHVFRHIFKGNRNDVRIAASKAAMFYAIKILKDKSIDYEEILIN